MDVLHTSLFCTMSINLYSLAVARNIIIYPLLVLYQFEFRTRSHFFASSIISSSFPNLFPQMAPLTAATRWQSEEGRYGLYVGGGGGGGQSIRVLWLGPVFSKACAVVICAEGCILRGRTLLKRFSKVLRVWMYRTEPIVWPRGIMFTKFTTLCTPPKQQSWISPAEEVALNLLT